MGQRAQILLVMALAGALLFPSALFAQGKAAYWLWSGVRPTQTLRDADIVYLHQGDVVTVAGQTVFERKGLPVNQLTFPRIWLTVRFTTLDVPDALLLRLTRLLARWQAAGNHVVGLQVDFDAATHRLGDYALFLHRLRQTLPADYALGVTGLLDWAKTGSVQTLNALPVDELVVQSYQGRSTVANYTAYLPALLALRIPFKLGLVQNGVRDISEEQQLAASPWYRGTVTFMLNPSRGGSSQKGYQ
ncbi:DUF3142 domain-containing protein [Kosakonia sacchari]|uniref:DUF3142 domain-containing protein n=1 Tax=Kosakonia sacchari TaxID=1158459 RepID=A0ABZ0MLT7_9ENTR|nr:DUF3142 domain-containing protein [Kosakonia sacchari]WOZ76435.1 DUF3142 domain-containing protein [Kosakonia sacchari]